MVLALTVPNGTPGLLKPLLCEGSGPPFPVTVADIGTPLSTLSPLTRAYYVDAGTPGTLAEQNGSIAFPFATVQQGVAALALVGGGALLIAPGTYNEAVAAGGAGIEIDFINVGGGATGAAATITAISLQGGPVALYQMTVGTITMPTSSTLRLQGSTITGNLTAAAMVANSSSVTAGSTTCNALAANDSTFAAVTASGSLTLKDSVFSGAVTSTAAGATHRIDDSRFTTYTANGAGATTVMRGCILSGNLACTIADIANCTLGQQLTTTGAATVRFSSIAAQCTVGGAAVFYQFRLSNVTAITGALTTDFASIAGVLPVLSYGSIIVLQTTPRITVSVVVPLVGGGEVGYVNVSLVGTDLEGMLSADSLIVCNPQVDLAAGPAGGGYVNIRYQAANTVRLAFLNSIAGGARNFTIGLV